MLNSPQYIPRDVAASLAARSLLLGFGLVLFGLSLPALIFVCYLTPDGCDSLFSLNHAGMHQFEVSLGLTHLPVLGCRAFSEALRLAMSLLWISYALIILAGLCGTCLRIRLSQAWVLAAAVVTAVFAPPLFSTDIYAYLAHGRIFAIYGQNPYLWKPSGLLAYHDPVTRFLSWDWPTVYGPVWTWLEIAAAFSARSFSLWGQIVVLKLMAAAGLIGAAFAGERLAARLSPGRETLTFLAIGLNPLLLIEGPGCGHNDVVCLSLLLWSAVLYFDKKYAAAALLLGLSIGIKPVNLAVLPLVLLEYCRDRSWRQRWTGVVFGTGLTLLLPAVLFAPFWAGPATIAAMHQRTAYAQAHKTLDHALLVAAYLVLGVWVWKRREEGGWLSASALFSVAMMFLFLVPAFPWYIVWFFPIFLLRWQRWSLVFSAACLIFSFYSVLTYAAVKEVKASPVQLWINLDGTRTAHH